MAKKLIHLPNREHAVTRRANPGTIVDFLEFLGLDTYKMGGFANGIDDFDGDTLDGRYQTATSGAGVAAAINTGTVNGAIDMAAGATDDGSSALSMGLHFRGDHYPVFVVGLEIDTITTVKVEAGFTDVVAGTDTGAVNVLATPSFNATDFVGWVLDTDDTANWQGVGVAAGTGATKLEPGNPPVAATQEILAVALIDDNAYFYQLSANGDMVENVSKTTGIMTSAVTKTVLLTPWLFVQARSANARIITVDFWGAWQRRTT